MPIQRKVTPPTSQIKEQKTVLSSLSAWTDNEDPETDGKEADTKREGYRLIGAPQGAEVGTAPSEGSVATNAKWTSRFIPDVEADNFNVFVGAVIISNAIVIGLETDFGRGNFALLEHFFNFTFVMEMVLRIRHMGLMGYLSETWNYFDCLLVFIGSLDLWVLPLVTPAGGAGSNIGYKFTSIRLLRILRLLRVLRVIRLFRMFQQLYLIVQAFNKAFQIVMLIFIIVLIIDYVLAIVLTQAVGQRKESWGGEADLIQNWFGTIPRSMNTLFIVMTLSDWETIATVLVKVIPAPVVFISFVGYIMVTSYTMVSLITGIISESLITAQQEYKRRKLQTIEKRRKKLITEQREFLHEYHEEAIDGEGCVAADDLKQSVRGDQELLRKLGDIGISIAENGILDLADKITDSQTRVNIDYFVEKLCNMTGAATMSSLVDLKYDVVKSQGTVGKVESKLAMLVAKMYPEDATAAEQKAKEKEKTPLPVVIAGQVRASRQSDEGGGNVGKAASSKEKKKLKMKFAEE